MNIRDVLIIGGGATAFALDQMAPVAGHYIFPNQIDEYIQNRVVSNWRRQIRSFFDRSFPPGTIRRWVITEIIWENMWVTTFLLACCFSRPDALILQLTTEQKLVLLGACFFAGCFLQHYMKQLAKTIKNGI